MAERSNEMERGRIEEADHVVVRFSQKASVGSEGNLGATAVFVKALLSRGPGLRVPKHEHGVGARGREEFFRRD